MEQERNIYIESEERRTKMHLGMSTGQGNPRGLRVRVPLGYGSGSAVDHVTHTRLQTRTHNGCDLISHDIGGAKHGILNTLFTWLSNSK